MVQINFMKKVRLLDNGLYVKTNFLNGTKSTIYFKYLTPIHSMYWLSGVYGSNKKYYLINVIN